MRRATALRGLLSDAKLPRAWHDPHDTPSAAAIVFISASNSGTVNPVNTFTPGVSTSTGRWRLIPGPGND